MPLVITVLAPGFAGSETLRACRRQRPADAALSRLCRPGDRDDGAAERAGPFCADGVLAAAVQHRADRRSWSCCWSWPQDAVRAAQIIAATVGIAGLLQLSILVLRMAAASRRRCAISFDKEMRGFFAKAIPGMIASTGPQLLIVAGAIIASSSPSAVSWLYFANRLIELPLGIVGVAMGTVLVPETDARGARRRSRRDRACRIARPRTCGRTGAAGDARPDRAERADRGDCCSSMARSPQPTPRRPRSALMWLALGLPAQVLVKALSPAFFAREDTTDAAARDAQRRRGRDRPGGPARPFLRHRRHRRQHRARRLEQRAHPDPQGRRDIRLFDRCRRAPAAATHRRSPRWRWARCSGLRRAARAG